MQLKQYQQQAVQELLRDSKKLLGQSGRKKLIFKAPTGSGKTVMMAEFLKLISNDSEVSEPLSFIWTAPRKLHEQSKRKLEKYFENSNYLECSVFEDLDSRKICENEILFFNWESINKKDNVYIRENEKENNLSSVIQRTKISGCSLVLIIDESHHHASSEISKKLIHEISPKLTVEVTATPLLNTDTDKIVNVPLDDVKSEGMIKNSVVLNPEFDNLLDEEELESSLAEGSDAMVLGAAIKKRNELAIAYNNTGANINPLILIQLPDKITGVEDQLKGDVIRLLKSNYNITVENGKLGIYLSAEKKNLENISKNNHETEVLIFKQAIALGWDCPRAQVLVLFRNWKSITFSLQTVGRIMRMPEPDKGHYKNNILNEAYVYTNLSRIYINEEITQDYFTINTCSRIDYYKPINLVSYHRIRHREKTRLSPLFLELFLQEAKNYSLKKKIRTKNQKLQVSFISEYETENVGDLLGEEILADKNVDTENEYDLQKLFDFFVRQNLAPFHPEDRSIGRVKEAIYKFFSIEMKIDYSKKFNTIIKIVLSEENDTHFKNVLDMTKEIYSAEVLKRENEFIEDIEWEVPVSINFGGKYKKLNTTKSVIQPFFYDYRWNTEKQFIAKIEKSKIVVWWYKNGTGDRTNFSVKYMEREEIKLFYIDFIVKFTDGRLGLFDTKSGNTIRSSRDKIDGLKAYIKKYGPKKNIFGGIVSNTDPINFSGRWMIFTGLGKDLVVNDFTNWELLEL